MERSNVRVGRGAPIDDDGIWLSGMTEKEWDEEEEKDNEDEEEESGRVISQAFLQRWQLLVKHLHIFLPKGGNIGQINTTSSIGNRVLFDCTYNKN